MSKRTLLHPTPKGPWPFARRPAVLAALLLLTAATEALADGKIYRCTDHGKTTFQDGPCETKPGFWPPFVASEGPGPVSSAASGSGQAAGATRAPGAGAQAPTGEWRGQTQYQGSENGQNLPGSQSVVPVVISLSSDGKVTGSSAGNGCHILGIWGPGIAPTIAALDVTLNGCSDTGFNRRYSGFLTGSASQQSAQLSLQAYDTALGKSARLYDVKSSLRR